jgi:hypothetical protein
MIDQLVRRPGSLVRRQMSPGAVDEQATGVERGEVGGAPLIDEDVGSGPSETREIRLGVREYPQAGSCRCFLSHGDTMSSLDCDCFADQDADSGRMTHSARPRQAARLHSEDVCD